MSLADREREKYLRAFETPGYRDKNQGLLLWQNTRGIFPAKPKSAIDIGCGDGRLFSVWNLAGIDGWGVDFINVLDKFHGFKEKFVEANLWEPLLSRRNYDVTNLDSAEAPKYPPARFELGVCADVMEHIPPEKVDEVLANICPLAEHTIFEIANYPSIYGDLHLSLHDEGWWYKKLAEHGTPELLENKREGVREYIFRFTPRRSIADIDLTASAHSVASSEEKIQNVARKRWPRGR